MPHNTSDIETYFKRKISTSEFKVLKELGIAANNSAVLNYEFSIEEEKILSKWDEKGYITFNGNTLMLSKKLVKILQQIV